AGADDRRWLPAPGAASGQELGCASPGRTLIAKAQRAMLHSEGTTTLEIDGKARGPDARTRAKNRDNPRQCKARWRHRLRRGPDRHAHGADHPSHPALA